MEKPQVRIIEPQSEEIINTPISNYEKELLLLKYGLNNEIVNRETVANPNRHLTFEEMVAIEEQKQLEIRRKEFELRNRPKPISIDSDKVNYHESKYSSMDLDGFDLGIQVQIFSDMPIKNRR
jgi:hypothetical protein